MTIRLAALLIVVGLLVGCLTKTIHVPDKHWVIGNKEAAK